MPSAATKTTNRVDGGRSRLSRQRRLRAAPTRKKATCQERQKVYPITAEALSWLPKTQSPFHADRNSPTDQGFYERQMERLDRDSRLNAELTSAITPFLKR